MTLKKIQVYRFSAIMSQGKETHCEYILYDLCVYVTNDTIPQVGWVVGWLNILGEHVSSTLVDCHD